MQARSPDRIRRPKRRAAGSARSFGFGQATGGIQRSPALSGIARAVRRSAICWAIFVQTAECHCVAGRVYRRREISHSRSRRSRSGGKRLRVLLKDYADADKWFTKAVAWNPRDALGWYYLARTKYNENRFAEAISGFRKCLALNGKDVKAEDNLVFVEGTESSGRCHCGLSHRDLVASGCSSQGCRTLFEFGELCWRITRRPPKD